MKTKLNFITRITQHLSLVALLLLSTISYQLSTSSAHAQGTGFTYQGRLNDGANLATGNYDLRFALYDAASAGAQQGNFLTNAATAVSNGLFTVTLDFGNQFPGADRWLEIGVRTNGGGMFSPLTPRQPLTATPYAIQAANAATASSVAAGNITGTILNASLPTSPNYSGTVTATSFSGSGAGVTAVNAGNISSGTLSDARLSGNVALLNASQTFTGANTFNNPANSFNGTHTGSGAALTNLNLMNAVPGWAVTLSTNINSNPAFTLASAPLSGTTPKCVLAVDLNGDGKLDLISANEGDSTLTVRTNNGSGAYVLSATLGAVLLDTGAFFPNALATMDVNSDGKADLICANDNTNTLSIFTNNGSGGLVLSSTLVVGNRPVGVVTGDVNGDGKADLISVNYATNTLSVLTNNGSGGFSLRSSPASGFAFSPCSVAAADVNGDAAIDLVCASVAATNLTVLLGTGAGDFVLASSPSIVSFGHSLTLADVNGDSKVDVIAANYGQNSLMVLTNNGGGTFGSNATLTVSSPRSVVVADVNGDSKPDLITESYFANALAIFTNNGSGRFALAVSPAVGSHPIGVTAADLNGDGWQDLVSANRDDVTLSVLLNTSAIATTNTSAVLQGNFTGSTLTISGNLAAGSFSGDGSALTALNAANLTGTVPDARLSANVALLDNSQTFTGAKTFNNAASSFTGSGAGLTSLNASQLASGTVPLAQLSGLTSSQLNAATWQLATNLNGGNAALATNVISGISITNAFITNSIFAGNGSGLTGLNASQLTTGTLPLAQLPGVAVTNNGTGITLAGVFSGNGGGLTNLNASQIAAGILADARLGSNVALLNAAQIFSADKSFTNGAQLRLDDGTNNALALTFNNENTGIYEPAPNSIAIVNAGNEHIRINSVGHVGILTNAPSVPLEVAGAAKITGNVTIGAFPILTVSTIAPAAGSTLSPVTGYVKVNPSTVMSLSFSTAIANGSTPGQLLVLQGITSGGSCAITNGANTALGSNRRFVDSNDVLVLVWDGSNWVEVSYTNN